MRGLEGRAPVPTALALVLTGRAGRQPGGGGTTTCFSLFLFFRALITVLSSELPNEAVWISCCSGFPRPLRASITLGACQVGRQVLW